MWPMIAMAGVGMLSNMMQQKQQDKQTAKDIRQESEQVAANNKALMAETARAAGEIRRQQAYDTIRTAQALQHVKQQANSIAAGDNVSAAMSDRIGSATAVIKSEIARQQGEAETSIWVNNELNLENAKVAMDTMLNQAKQSFQVPGIKATPDNTRSIFLNGVISMGSAAIAGGAFSGPGAKSSTPKGK
jgi:hypothetical protein